MVPKKCFRCVTTTFEDKTTKNVSTIYVFIVVELIESREVFRRGNIIGIGSAL